MGRGFLLGEAQQAREGKQCQRAGNPSKARYHGATFKNWRNESPATIMRPPQRKRRKAPSFPRRRRVEGDKPEIRQACRRVKERAPGWGAGASARNRGMGCLARKGLGCLTLSVRGTFSRV